MEASNPANYEVMPQQEKQEEDEWFLQQFRRVPLLLYQGWLIISFPIALLFELSLLISWYDTTFSRSPRLFDARVIIGFMFSLYGCCQMLYAINKRKSRIAEESFLKFQYALIGSASVVYNILSSVHLQKIVGEISVELSYVVFTPVVHVIGGFVVLGVFKNNHPLRRSRGSQAAREGNQDFWEQNEAIASEVSKYDEQLNKWPYIIYKWILKISVVLELIFLMRYTVPDFQQFWQMPEEERQFSGINSGIFMYLFIIEGGISSLLNAYCCFQMEIGVRTKNLAKSQSAIALLKICVVLSIIKCLLVGEYADFDEMFQGDCLLWFAAFILVPVLSLIGALKAKKIMEERDKFVKFSSYSQDAYL